jgi:hypothetical protein
MSQASQSFASYSAAINAQQTHRPHGPAGAGARTVAKQDGADSGIRTSHSETVIAELVNQYFRCSTTTSGAFLCW